MLSLLKWTVFVMPTTARILKYSEDTEAFKPLHTLANFFKR